MNIAVDAVGIGYTTPPKWNRTWARHGPKCTCMQWDVVMAARSRFNRPPWTTVQPRVEDFAVEVTPEEDEDHEDQVVVAIVKSLQINDAPTEWEVAEDVGAGEVSEEEDATWTVLPKEKDKD